MRSLGAWSLATAAVSQMHARSLYVVHSFSANFACMEYGIVNRFSTLLNGSSNESTLSWYTGGTGWGALWSFSMNAIFVEVWEGGLFQQMSRQGRLQLEPKWDVLAQAFIMRKAALRCEH